MSTERITIEPNICHGKPNIRGTMMMVESILEYLAGGSTVEEILENFSDLQKADILACIAYASKVVHFKNENVALV
jgi:uncharacterized protein (DUF433 family)